MMMIVLAALLAAEQTFLAAVKDRDADTVRTMLTGQPSLAMTKNEKGNSAVMLALFALKKGEESFPDPATNATLQAILERKPQLDIYETAAVGTPKQLEAMLRADPEALKRLSKFGWTLLHLAAYGGNTANTELLIRRGADVNMRAKSRFRNTPLQTALLSGQYGTAKLLLENGADALVRQAEGIAPMHEAAQLGRADIVELLLANGAEINSIDDAGRTPLAFAVKAKHDDLVTMMKAKGARLEAKTPEE
jgi:uncharacterized protein